MKGNKDLNKYLKDVSKIIPISGKDKRKFIKALKQRILGNEAYNENMTYNDIEKYYGKPKEVGIGFLDDIDNETLLTRINYSLFIKRLAIVITIIACLSFMCVSSFEIYKLECLYEQALIDTDLHENTKLEYNSESEIISEEVK